MARGSPTSDRDQRSLARQMAEDEVVELTDQDVGGGVIKFLSSDSSDDIALGLKPGQENRR